MNSTKVSICVPIYGVEQFIRRCLISLFEQTYPNIEYIFVNDCTPDNSINILIETLNQYPQRKEQVKIISHKVNQGLSAARNTGIQHCTGEFIMWVDPDDYIALDTIELAIKKQQETNSDIVSFDIRVYYKKYSIDWITPLYTSPAEMAQCIIARNAPITLVGRLIRLSLYKNHDLRAKEGINMSEDYQISTRLAYYAKKVSTLNKILYHYDRTNEDAYTYKITINKIEQTWTSFNIVKDFFYDKGESYRLALRKAEVIFVNDAIISCCKNPDNDEFFSTTLRQRIMSTDKTLWHILPAPKRIIFYIKKASLIRIYISISKHIQSLLYKK